MLDFDNSRFNSVGEAKNQHGLRRAVRRGLANVAIQAYLTAAVINLKRLVTYAGGIFDNFFAYSVDILAIVANIIVLRMFLTNRIRKLTWETAE